MSQMSFSDFEYAGKRKQTRRERFLAGAGHAERAETLHAVHEPSVDLGDHEIVVDREHVAPTHVDLLAVACHRERQPAMVRG